MDKTVLSAIEPAMASELSISLPPVPYAFICIDEAVERALSPFVIIVMFCSGFKKPKIYDTVEEALSGLEKRFCQTFQRRFPFF